MDTTVTNALLSAASSASSSGKSDETKLTASDFLKLFVTQMQNQDFNDPVDNSEMMNQITQLSNMQMMQEMAAYSKANYAMSLVGKTVTAYRYNNGEIENTTGLVSKVVLENDEYVLYVGGKKYDLNEVTTIRDGSDDGASLDVSSYPVSVTSVTNNSATVQWSVPTEDAEIADGLKYTVFYSQEGPFDTVGDVEGGTQFGAAGQKDLLGATVTGLEAGQTYYVNVLVEDAEGNKYVYSPALLATNQ